MYVIPSKKFCYIAAPRTGSKACGRALMEHRGAMLVGSHHTTPDDNPEFEIGKDWTVCSTIRNHFDAMISWYFKIERHGTMTPLHKFLPRFCENNPNFVRDNRLWWSGAAHVNAVIRYEHLQFDFDMALVKAGMAPLDLPKVIDSKREGAPYQALYKRPSIVWVAEYFKEEIALCHYKF